MQPILAKYMSNQAPKNPQDLSALDMYMATPEGQAALGQAEQQPVPAMASSPLQQPQMPAGPTAPATLDAYQKNAAAADTQQQAQMAQLQKYIQNYAMQKPDEIDYSAPSALLASLDAKYKPLAEQMGKNKPQSQEARAKELIDMQQKLTSTEQKGSLGSLNALRQMLGLGISQQKADAFTRSADYRGQSIGLREDEQAARAVDKVTTNKQLNGHIDRIQGADRILSQLDAADRGEIVDTPQLLEDVNNEYRALITGRNNSPEGSQERGSYNTAASKMSSIMQKISAEPKSINSPAIMKQLRDSVVDLKTTYQKNVDVTADRLNREYHHNAAAQKAIKGSIDEVKSQYGSKANKSIAPSKPAPTAPQVGDIEDGHKFLGGNPADPASWEMVQ